MNWAFQFDQSFSIIRTFAKNISVMGISSVTARFWNSYMKINSISKSRRALLVHSWRFPSRKFVLYDLLEARSIIGQRVSAPFSLL